MVGKGKILFFGDFGLKPFYGLILEFFDLAALDTNHMIVVIALIQLEN